MRRLAKDGCKTSYCARLTDYASQIAKAGQAPRMDMKSPEVGFLCFSDKNSETDFVSNFTQKVKTVTHKPAADLLHKYRTVFPDQLPNELPPI